MDYRVASNIRGKSLSSLITDRITSGGSVGSSIKSAISDKLKAKGTGIKEKFDPMNIARAMTGGGKLAPAILGKITGRSQSDINYFAGNKKKSSYKKMPSTGQTPGEGLGGSAIEVLNKMLSFMQKNREDDLTRKQTSMAFEEEKQSEEQRRHDQFLKVLKDYTSLSGGTTTIVKKEEGDGFLSGLMDTIKSMIKTAVDSVLSVVDGLIKGFEKSLEWLGDLKTLMSFLGGNSLKLLLSLGRFLISPFGGALIIALAGSGAIVWLADQLKDYLRENVVNMNALSPEKAAELLQTPGAYREIEKAGGREALMKIAKEGHLEAQKILDTQDIKKINDAGGRPFLEQVVARGAVTVPESAANQDLSQFEKQLALKRPKGSGLAVKNQQADWDAKYGKIYDPETGMRLDLLNAKNVTTATPLPEGVKPSTAGGGRGNINPGMPTSTPIPSTPPSSGVVDRTQENNNLNMQTPVSSGGSSSPSVSVNSSSTSAPDQTITSTATTRDDTAILDFVLNRTKSRV
jgi:hypothetical protein